MTRNITVTFQDTEAYNVDSKEEAIEELKKVYPNADIISVED